MKELKSLINRIKEDVREEAKKHPVYKNTGGSIRILMTPRSEDADAWLGGLSSFGKYANAGFGCVRTEEPDIMTYEFISAVSPNQDYDTIFKHPSAMSKVVSFVVFEREGEDVSEFVEIQICIFGARSVGDDTALADRAATAVLNWFEEPFEVSPEI